MNLFTNEITYLWIGVTMYAVAGVLITLSLVFARLGNLLGKGVAIGILGLIPHAVAIAIRWVQVGHGPYVGFYEVASSEAWVGVAIFALVAWRYPRLRGAGVLLFPATFLLVGGAVLSPSEPKELIPALRSWWLVLHVIFAKLAYGPYLLALDLSVLYWLKVKGFIKADVINRRLPEPAVLDEIAYRLIGFGFLMHGVMNVAGAIWANQAWGSYWSWDPIETWSLISWIVFAIVLHLRLVHGWRGGRAVGSVIVAGIVTVFAFFAVPYIYGGSHLPLISF